MKKALTREQLIRLMKSRQGTKTQAQFADELGISGAYLSDIYAGKKDPGETVLSKLGLSRVTIYQPAVQQ